MARITKTNNSRGMTLLFKQSDSSFPELPATCEHVLGRLAHQFTSRLNEFICKWNSTEFYQAGFCPFTASHLIWSQV